MNKNEIIISARLIITHRELTHLLDRCSSPETVFDLLKEDPEQAEACVRKMTQEYLGNTDSDVRINGVTFMYCDSWNFLNASAYFSVLLSGTAAEMLKVVGEDKLFKRIDR